MSLEGFKDKIKADELISKYLQKNNNKEKSNAFYYKTKIKDLTSKCEQHRKINFIKKSVMEWFKDGKFTNDVWHKVCYIMLHASVSTEKCGDVLKIILNSIANTDVDKRMKEKFCCKNVWRNRGIV